jgi:hypothetical protein
MKGGDTIAAQRERLLAGLAGQRVSRPDLERALDIPSVSKRICELIAEGWPIERARDYIEGTHGLRRTTFYRLTGPRRQRDLFERFG